MVPQTCQDLYLSAEPGVTLSAARCGTKKVKKIIWLLFYANNVFLQYYGCFQGTIHISSECLLPYHSHHAHIKMPLTTLHSSLDFLDLLHPLSFSSQVHSQSTRVLLWLCLFPTLFCLGPLKWRNLWSPSVRRKAYHILKADTENPKQWYLHMVSCFVISFPVHTLFRAGAL